ncbi:MAG: TatD family hydrolase, partial [Deltaproteobacteria bacterium]|nr:TatD family hydrolase [Deltaproteobacteria bacterium]
MTLIDSHCHLSFKDYAESDIPAILQRAVSAGVSLLINVGAGEGYEGNEQALALAKKHPQIYCTVGIHPHDAKIVTPEIFKKIESLAQNPKVVAIGEIGLDFYYEHSPRDAQEKVFARFIDLALKLKKPAMIHDRGAGERCYEILRDKMINSSVMIHCFTGSMDLAKKYLDLGCFISFTGIITFKKS